MRNKFPALALAAIIAVVPGVIAFSATPAAAADPTCSGTVTSPCLFHNFEIDGDTAPDSGVSGALDWKSPDVVGSPALNTFPDLSNSNSDNIFTNGAKEADQSTWQCGTGKPPSKDDIAGGQIWFQTINNTQYIYGDFTRVGTTGSAHIDYEFNKATNTLTGTCAGLPIRQKDDVLIAFDTGNGGATITVTAYKYSGSGWTQITTDQNQFAGLANIAPARSDNGVPAGAFGEAGLDLTDTVGTFKCNEFGAAWMKTRAAVGGGTGAVTDSTASLKDYTSPQPINLGTCPKSQLVKTVHDDTQDPASPPNVPPTQGPLTGVNPGDQLTYTLTYTNTGKAPATNVTISDPLPAHSTFDSCTNSCTVDTSTTPNTINWSPVPSVAPGGTVTDSFTVTLDHNFQAGTTTPIFNTGVVTTAEESGSTNSNKVEVDVSANASLSITKTADSNGSTVNSGGTLGYNITVNNTGNVDAAGVTITDNLPATGSSWTIVSPASGCSISQTNVLTCGPMPLAAGSSFTVHITSTATQSACGTVNNTASVSATNAATQTTSQIPITVTCPKSDLAKTVHDDTADPTGQVAPAATISSSPGHTLTYTLTYTNNGNGAATGVTISDPIPANTTFVSCSNSCTQTAGSVSWTVGTVAAGATVTRTFTVTLASVFPQGTTQVTNVAVVTTNQEGSTQSPPATVNVSAGANLMLTKTPDSNGATVNSGGTIGYIITLKNTGDADATGVVISDTLPTNTGLAWSFDNPGCTIANSDPTHPNQPILTCGPMSLAANGGTFTVHITSPTQGTCGTVSNTATATATGGLTASSKDTNNGNATTITVTCPSSSLAKTVHDDTADPTGQVAPAATISSSPGHTLTYTLTYSNNGNGAATGVTISDPIPANTTFVSCSNSCTQGGGSVSWTVGTVAAGATVTRTFTVTLASVFPQGTTQVTNVAVVTTDQEGSTQSPPATVNVTASPTLALTKTPDSNGATVNSGSTIGYIITLKNTGDADATGVVISDTLPTNTGLAWSFDNPACSIGNTDPTHPNQPILTCTVGTLAANGGTFTVHITSPTQGTCGTVSNTATATATGGLSASSNDQNNGNPTQITVTCPRSSLAKTVHDDTADPTDQIPPAVTIGANPGDTLTYTLTYTNNGNGAATGVTISDPIPANTTFVSCSNSCTQGGGSVSWTVGTVAAGATVTRTFTVTLASVFPQGTTQVTNVAVVTTDQEGSTQSPPATVNVSAGAILTLIKTADSPSVNDGEGIGYTITLKNTGNADATGVVITDVLPTNSGLAWSFDNPACSIANSDPTHPNQPILTCTVGTLAANGGTFTVHITSPTQGTAPQTCGTVSNTATATATGGLTATSKDANNGQSTQIVVNCASVSIVKTADSNTVAAGQQVGYTLTVANSGTGVAKNVKVTDSLPSNISGLNWSLSPAGTPSGCTISGTPQVLNCTFATVGAGASITIHVVSPTPSGTCGTLSNTATVTSDNGGGNTTSAVVITVTLPNTGAATHGSSYGLDVNALGLELINHLGSAATAATPAAPNPAPVDNDVLTVPSILGIVSADVVNNTSTSQITNQSVSTATSTIAHVNLLGGAIQADAIKGVSQSTATPTTASFNSTGSTFTNLTINGKSVVNVSPNTNVTVYVPGTKIVLAKAVLYEQSGTSGLTGSLWSASHSVTMIDITLVQGLGVLPPGAKITVAHAQSDAAYPSGLGCGANPNTVSGNAYTAYANGTFLGTTLVNAQVGNAVLPSTGGSSTDNIALVNLAPLAAAGAGVNYTNGQTATSPVTANSGSNVANVNLLGGLVTANAIDVASRSSAPATGANTTFGATCANGTCPRGCSTSSPCFVNLAVNGQTIVGINGGTVPPNTVIAIPQPDGSLVEVILNEQIVSSSGGNTQGDINAIHVYVLKGNGLLSAEVIVAHAHSDAHHSS